MKYHSYKMKYVGQQIRDYNRNDSSSSPRYWLKDDINLSMKFGYGIKRLKVSRTRR